MDNDLLSSFLETLKEVNSTLLELAKVTASNQLALRIIGVFSVIAAGCFFTWLFTYLSKIPSGGG